MEKSQFEIMLSDLEVRLDRLSSLYEQYFIGIEKLEPSVPRKDVDRRLWEMRKVKVRNTALRFRFQTLIQRYNTLQQHWMRICRQIENGSYSRHLRRAARLLEAEAPVPAASPESPFRAEDAPSKALDLGSMLAEELAGNADLAHAIDAALAAGNTLPPRVTTAVAAGLSTPLAAGPSAQPAEGGPAQPERRPRPARPTTEPSRPLSDDRIRDLYSELARAREGLKQGSVSALSVEQKLRATEAQLRKQHPGKGVDFRVEVKDGKAIIKPFLQ